MKITLLTVGKTDIKWVKEGLEMYSGRISRYVPFSVTEIPELKNVSALSVEQIKKRRRNSYSGTSASRTNWCCWTSAASGALRWHSHPGWKTG